MKSQQSLPFWSIEVANKLKGTSSSHIEFLFETRVTRESNFSSYDWESFWLLQVFSLVSDTCKKTLHRGLEIFENLI